jgi:hypothetical protein
LACQLYCMAQAQAQAQAHAETIQAKAQGAL